MGVILIKKNVRNENEVGEKFKVINRGVKIGKRKKEDVDMDELKRMMEGGKEIEDIKDEMGGRV